MAWIGVYCSGLGSHGRSVIPIDTDWGSIDMGGGDQYVILHWLNTFLCNLKCSYCSMSHDRKAGHAFDYASPAKWAERFNRLDFPFAFYITGGEPLLDIGNFTEFYNLVIENEMLLNIRIDTNGTIAPGRLAGLNVKKTTLNVSFHEAQVPFDRLLSNLNGYRELGFAVSMVNMVCKGEDIDKYQKYKKKFLDNGYTLNPGIYMGGDYPKSNAEIRKYMDVLDKFDVGMKTKTFSPKGLRCNASRHFRSIWANGAMKDCWGPKGNFLTDDLLLDREPRACPCDSCTCIEQYGLLDICGKKPRYGLSDYIEQAVLAPPGEKTRIVSIIGYFGDDNMGDEALLASLLDRLREVPHVLPVVIAFFNPERVSSMHNALAVNGMDAEATGNMIRMSDLVILGPGGLIEDYAYLDAKHFFKPLGMYRYLHPVVLSQLYGKPTVGYGLGIGPLHLEESKNAVKIAFANMKRIFVRDYKSLDTLNSIGLNNAAISSDAVVNLKSTRHDLTVQSIQTKAKSLIGISLRPFVGISNDNLVKHASRLIEHLVQNTDANILLMPMQFEYDMPLLTRLYAEAVSTSEAVKERIHLLLHRLHPKAFMELVGSMDLLIGMRLHSIIMAAATGRPFVAIAYDPKVSEFAGRVQMADYVIEAKAISSDILIEKAAAALEDAKALGVCQDEVASLKKLEDESWNYVLQLLNF